MFLIFSFQVFSMDVVLMGGGGENEGDTTIFDDALAKFALAKTRINANVQMAFNGGHKTTTSIIKEQIQVPNTEFTQDNYLKLINDSIFKINSGLIPKGGQLMVIVDTHGGMKEPFYDTHSIALSGAKLIDVTKISGPSTDSMDRFEALSKAAEDRGVKLAIVDMSCHSGSSLSLANKNTCVVSATGDKHFGYDSFTKAFYNQMEPGLTLEDVYLKARSDSHDLGFPMISSPVGKIINEKLYPLFTPYLYVRERNDADNLTSYIRETAQCENRDQRNLDFEKLLSTIDNFEKIARAVKGEYAGEYFLKDELSSYKRIQDQMLDELKRMNYPLLSKKDTITYPLSGKKKKRGSVKHFTYGDILQYPSGNLSYFEEELNDKVKNKSSIKEINEMTDNVNEIKAVLNRKAELNKLYPELMQTGTVFEKIVEQSQTIMSKAQSISELARKVYDQQYQSERAINKESNPCADFKF